MIRGTGKKEGRKEINETKNKRNNSEYHKLVVNSPTLYQGGSYLEPTAKRSHRHVLKVFINPSKEILKYCLKLRHAHCFQRPLHFSIHIARATNFLKFEHLPN
jgi:hypothetical protein